MSALTTQLRFAVLIDADNAKAETIEHILKEVSLLGQSTVRRAYGDWTTTSLTKWKELLNQHAIHPMQQFRYTAGKNATDSALIIDAMDLLHKEELDGFCLVSSDSDFTRLATRLREAGKLVVGFGESKTPEPFVKACERFHFLDELAPKPAAVKKAAVKKKAAAKTVKAVKGTKAATTVAAPTPVPPAAVAAPPANGNGRMPTADLQRDEKLISLLTDAVRKSVNETGWAALSKVATTILTLSSTFASRSYGYAKLLTLMQATEVFEFEARGTSTSPQYYVRNKPGL